MSGISKATLKYVLEYACAKLAEAEEAPPPPPEGGEVAAIDMAAVFGGEERLTLQQLEAILDGFDSHVSKITANHPEEPEHRALFFWEFFEVLMESSRSLVHTETPVEKVPRMWRHRSSERGDPCICADHDGRARPGSDLILAGLHGLGRSGRGSPASLRAANASVGLPTPSMMDRSIM